MEIHFPVEFHLPGTPVSGRGTPGSKERWMGKIAAAATSRLPEAWWASDAPIAVTIFHFPAAASIIDLDNIAKPIMDALTKLVYRDDSQIDRLLVQRFEAVDQDELTNPTPALAQALVSGRPHVYVRIDDDQSRGGP
jgi:hypothetical protein